MNYSIETSESIQEDILTCIEGFCVKGRITDIERLNDALCKIIVDKRMSKMSNV
jgi:hypothetical protein